MFNLKTKDLYEKVYFWKRFVFKSISLIFFLYFLFSFLILVIFNFSNLYYVNLIISVFVLFFFFFIEQIVELILKIYFRKRMINEMYQIVKDTKLPKNLPKVVYVYTTHNDFWESRLLQSMKQTYSNIEYWISDGSSNLEISKKIKDFCKKYNVHYHYLNRPSIHKADNLNHFLEHSGAKFDYLLISDADVAIHKNFVETSLKFFSSKNQIRLGWVSSMMQNHKSNNIFTNFCKVAEDIGFFNFSMKNIDSRYQVNLFSSASLIKKEMLEELDMKFPNSCLEDAWLEWFASRKYWCGLINVLTTSMQAFDNTILLNFNRIYRVGDWIIKLFKEHFFFRQNEEKRKTYNNLFIEIMITPISRMFFLLVLSLTIFFVCKNWEQISNKNDILFLIYVFLANFICFIFLKLIYLFNILRFAIFKHILVLPIVLMASFWYKFYRYVRAFFFSKYADFNPTRSSVNVSKKFSNIRKIKNFIYIFIISLFLLLSFNLPMIFLNIYNYSDAIFFIYIFSNVLLGSIWLSTFSFLFLYSLSFIKTNKKYDKNEFVYPNKRYEYLKNSAK